MSRRSTTSNQRWNNVADVNVGIYNVDQRWINIVYFKDDLNNVRQRGNNVIIVNVDFHKLGSVETTLWIWPYEKTNKPRGKHKIILLSFKEKLFDLNKMDLKLSSLYSLFWQEYVEEYLQSRKNS